MYVLGYCRSITGALCVYMCWKQYFSPGSGRGLIRVGEWHCLSLLMKIQCHTWTNTEVATCCDLKVFSNHGLRSEMKYDSGNTIRFLLVLLESCAPVGGISGYESIEV
jgi:hypothetical protein